MPSERDRFWRWRERATPFAAVTSLAAMVVAGTSVIDLFNPLSGGVAPWWTWLLIVAALCVSVIPFLMGERFPPAVALGACCVFVAVTLFQILVSDREIVSVNNLVLYPMLGCYLGWFFARRTARIVTGLAVGLSGAALGINAYPGLFTTWANLALASFFCLEAAGYLRIQLDRQIETDPLTGALNRFGLERRLDQELARAVRSGQPLSAALIDLDDLKKVNDLHGHGAGDVALSDLASAVLSATRSYDTLARIGGDEFVLLMPATDEAEATETLHRLREQTTNAWSFGLTTAQPGDTASTFLQRADRLLYVNKRTRKGFAAE